MSVFAGLVNFDGRPADARQLDRLAGALPRMDNRAVTQSRAGPAGFVHRAYFITPEDRFERQPWTGAGGKHHLVFAGSLDNRGALGEALGIAAADLRDMPDGRLCLLAAERWDDGAPEHLLGGFAYAYWDGRRLQLCRGLGNARSLFYHRGNGFLAFASSAQSLFALPAIPRELDLTVVGDLLAQNNAEEVRTVYRGIERLPRGCHAVCENGAVRVREYWNPERRDLGLTSHDDYVEAARALLDVCVASALRSEKPVAVATSGGLDSSGIAGTAARALAPRRLAAYTRVPAPGFARAETARAYFDERAKVEALARLHANMDVTFIDTAGPHVFDGEPSRAAATFGMPVITAVNLGWFSPLYERVRDNGHRVLVDGSWGNTSLGWKAPRRIEAILRDGDLGGAAKEALAYRRTTGRSWLSILKNNVLRPLEPARLRRARRRWMGKGIGPEHTTFIAPDFARAHDIAGRIAQFSIWREELRKTDLFERRAFKLVRGEEVIRDWVSTVIDVFGFEIRSPLTDPRMIEFCLNVPDEHFQHEGRPRALQRDVIADRVPREIVDNYKLGAQAPEWFARLDSVRDRLQADIERIARSPSASHLIDLKRLRRAVEDWPADADAAEERTVELRFGMMRAIAVGRFLCWFEGSNS